MDTKRKCPVLSVVAFIVIIGLWFMIKTARTRQSAPIPEQAQKGTDEELKRSMGALQKATAHIESIIERIKGMKS
jgi:hypothetical protein